MDELEEILFIEALESLLERGLVRLNADRTYEVEPTIIGSASTCDPG